MIGKILKIFKDGEKTEKKSQTTYFREGKEGSGILGKFVD